MIPSPWEFVLLALAAYRLTRLAGWDEFPLAARVRAALIGERWISPPVGQHYETLHDAARAIAEHEDARSLPGKQPTSEAEGVVPAYDRPTLAHLIHCPFCIGFWISAAAWGAWVAGGDVALACLLPFAVSGAVGLVARNLDP